MEQLLSAPCGFSPVSAGGGGAAFCLPPPAPRAGRPQEALPGPLLLRPAQAWTAGSHGDHVAADGGSPLPLLKWAVPLGNSFPWERDCVDA